jgi:hypothetical protein
MIFPEETKIFHHYHCHRIYDASSPAVDGAWEGRRSTAGWDLVSKGEVGFDGGEVAMLSSKLARALQATLVKTGSEKGVRIESYLNAFIDAEASLSSFFPAVGVPERLLAALSSLPRTKLPPGPRFLRPLLLRDPSMLDGPKDIGWVLLRVVRRRRRSSLPTLLDA